MGVQQVEDRTTAKEDLKKDEGNKPAGKREIFIWQHILSNIEDAYLRVEFENRFPPGLTSVLFLGSYAGHRNMRDVRKCWGSSKESLHSHGDLLTFQRLFISKEFWINGYSCTCIWELDKLFQATFQDRHTWRWQTIYCTASFKGDKFNRASVVGCSMSPNRPGLAGQVSLSSPGVMGFSIRTHTVWSLAWY